MSFSGNLHGIGLSDVFQNISANRTDGTLCIRWRRTERFVRFDGGSVTGFSLGVGRGLPLADHLRARGYVDPGELDRVLSRGRRSRKAATRLCVEAGLLDDETVQRAMAECAEEGLYDLFALREADFTFEEGKAPSRVFDGEQARVGLRLEVGPILMEAVRRRDECERIHKVVTSDEDVFVLLEGFEERVADETGEMVAGLLDGRRSAGSIAAEISRSPFHVHKAIFELVQAGVARPATAEELAEAAEGELGAEAVDDAIRLMARALEQARNDVELRVRYAELLERVGRGTDAAVEHARIGHDAERASDFDVARAAYDRAVELSPDDLALQEKRVALLEQCADDDDLAAALLAVVERHAAMGLADRSRTMLADVVKRRGLDAREDVVTALARVESSLGHWQEAARLFRDLGERVLRSDEDHGLELLCEALDQAPDDAELSVRVDELQSGRARRRRALRRKICVVASTLAVLTAVGFAGVAEMNAARRAASALGMGLGGLAEGEGVVALEELGEIADSYAWTPTGRSIPGWIDRLVDLQLDAVRAHVAATRYDAAVEICAQLGEGLDRPDLRATCTALLDRIGREKAAFVVLERVERRQSQPEVGDLESLEALGVPGHLEFLLERLPRIRDHQVRAALLRALERIDDPRSYPVVARVLIGSGDDATHAAARAVLRGAAAHRRAGREAEWREVYAELETALADPSKEALARDALDLLRGA